MKRKLMLLLSVGIFYAQLLSSQVVRQIQAPNAPNAPRFSNTQKSNGQALGEPILMTPNLSKEKKNWGVMLSQYGVSHGSEIPKNTTDSIKAAQGLIKKANAAKGLPGQSEVESPSSEFIVDPIVTLDFKGNTYNGWAPNDNSMAVSDDGFIVSVVNSSLMYTTTEGTVLLEESFDSYLGFLGLSGSYFDPRVIYDPSEDKFMMVILNGNSPGNSKVVIGFSTTSDPTDSWWFYVFNGDPGGVGAWFDFPSIGISTTELFVSGNLFDSNDDFEQSIIFEIEKGRGYQGQSMNGHYWIWNDVRDAYGNKDFTVAPISYGFDGTLGPGIFFISSNSAGGSDVMLYYTTDIGANNPSLEVFSASVLSYDLPINGYQLGSSDEIKTNDCRIQSGYWANGILHFALNTQFTDGYTRIYYGRLNTTDLTSTVKAYGAQSYEYAFPAIAPFTTNETDPTTLVGFLRTGSSIYPQFRIATVDQSANFSNSVLVKGGEDYVDFASGSIERWGDYSGISRRNLANNVEVWVSGSYGAFYDGDEFNVLSTWIGRISDEFILAPFVDFTANQTVITAGQQVQFTDLSGGNPTSWSWSFPGGTPSSSTQQNPTVTYNTPGTYDVTLSASNVGGSDAYTSTGYITVNPLVIAPVANFTANQTTITAGQQVAFTDLSTNTPTSWAWTFPGGTPSSSTQKNPTVTYNTPGTYNVSLTAGNSGGNDGETKVSYIVVNPAVITPVANFTANQTTLTAGQQVVFTDQSTNNPTSWSWTFPGGTPSSSTQQNPTVTYNTPGTYNVSLTAGNTAGNDGETKVSYIVVNPAVIAPVANFTANQTTITAGQQVVFTDQSTNNPTSWSWTFPGGTPNASTQQNPTVTYNTPGTYNVSLTASNGAGNDGETKALYIVVNPAVIAPVTNFTANQTTITAGQQVVFTDLSTNNPTSWSWSFPGGTPTSSTQQNPTVTYATPGTYNVSLTAGNGAGNDGETKVSYIVVNPAVITPVTDFSANQTTITAGQQVAFTDLSTNAPTSWLWSFPGGTPNSSTQQYPTVTYNTPGTYSVSLTTGNAAGNDGETKTAYIVVNPLVIAPVSNFSASQTSITTGQQITFTDLSTNSPIAWSWSFLGGTPSTSTLQNPIVTYNTPGTYSVTLISSNIAGGDEETKSGYITVTQPVQTPVADFSANVTQINVGGVVQFSDNSLNTPTSWTWSFVGGTPSVSTLQNPIIVYGAAGVYPVTLVAGNSAGNSVMTKTDYITVGISATEETGGVFNKFEVFPNPVAHERLNVVFEIEEKLELDFYILSSNGAVVKHLLRHRVKAGTNQLAFNTEVLPAGTYYIVAQNPAKKVFKNAKFVVLD